MDHASNLHAPPRLLLWAALTFFVLIIIAGLGGIAYFSSGRLSSLLPYGVIALLMLFLSVIGGSLLFRRTLPRLLWLWTTLGVAVSLMYD